MEGFFNMALKYSMVRMYDESTGKFLGKKVRLETDLSKVVGRPVMLTNTQFFKILADSKTDIDLREVQSLVSNGRYRRRNGGVYGL